MEPTCPESRLFVHVVVDLYHDSNANRLQTKYFVGADGKFEHP